MVDLKSLYLSKVEVVILEPFQSASKIGELPTLGELQERVIVPVGHDGTVGLTLETETDLLVERKSEGRLFYIIPHSGEDRLLDLLDGASIAVDLLRRLPAGHIAVALIKLRKVGNQTKLQTRTS